MPFLNTACVAGSSLSRWLSNQAAITNRIILFPSEMSDNVRLFLHLRMSPFFGSVTMTYLVQSSCLGVPHFRKILKKTFSLLSPVAVRSSVGM